MIYRQTLTVPVERVDFPSTQYRHETYEKKQIVLHYTASGAEVYGDLHHWRKTASRIATAFIVDRNGVIHEVFEPTKWAYHLGVGLRDNKVLLKYKQNGSLYDQHSIGIEIDNYGYLKYDKKKKIFTTAYGNQIDRDLAQHYLVKHRGHEWYEVFPVIQVEGVKQLLIGLSNQFSIPLNYYGDEFDVCTRALEFEKGVFTHNSYVSANLRTDIPPDPRIVEMWMNLPKSA